MLEKFIFGTLYTLRFSVLQRSLGKGKDESLLERTWQMELYRAATGLVSKDVCVSSDVGHMFGTNGMVDFFM
jgi:hypothetical protein